VRRELKGLHAPRHPHPPQRRGIYNIITATATATARALPHKVSTHMRIHMPRPLLNFLRDLGAAPHHPRVAVARMGHVAHNRGAHPRITVLYHRSGCSGIAAHPPPTSVAPHRAVADIAVVAEVCAAQWNIVRIATKTGGARETTVVLGLLCETGGMDLVSFLKGARDRTSEAVSLVDCGAPCQ
jgi:hypothetical protein